MRSSVSFGLSSGISRSAERNRFASKHAKKKNKNKEGKDTKKVLDERVEAELLSLGEIRASDEWMKDIEVIQEELSRVEGEMM